MKKKIYIGSRAGDSDFISKRRNLGVPGPIAGMAQENKREVRMEDRTLIKITEVTDDSTGNWRMGEIEFGITIGLLKDYLENYGEKGKKEIIDMLEYLKSKVEEYSERVV